MRIFSTADKLRELERELTMRHRVYRSQISRGKMSEARAREQIACLTAIVDDYKDKLREGPLFEAAERNGQIRGFSEG